MRLGLLGAVCLAVTGCAVEPDAPVPVVTFPGMTVEQVQNRLIPRCLAGGSEIETKPNQLVCYRDPTSGMDGVSSATLRVLGGGQLTNVVVFTMVQQGPDVVVQARRWLQSAGDFGHVRRTEFTDASSRNHLRRIMLEEASRRG